MSDTNPDNSAITETPTPLPDPAPAAIVPAAPLAPPENILKQFVRMIDRALADDPKRFGWELTCYVLLRTSGGQRLIINSADVTRLADWQAQHERVIQAMNDHGPDRAKADWMEHQKELARKIHTGELEDAVGMTVDELEKSYLILQNAFQEDLRRIYQECQPCCEELSERFLAIAVKRVDGIEKAEREQHENYGVQYGGPSNLIKSFRKALEIAKNRVVFNEFGTASPRQMVPYLTF